MTETITTRYDVAVRLRTPEEMAAYLEACPDETNGDAAFIAKAFGLKLHAEAERIATPGTVKTAFAGRNVRS